MCCVRVVCVINSSVARCDASVPACQLLVCVYVCVSRLEYVGRDRQADYCGCGLLLARTIAVADYCCGGLLLWLTIAVADYCWNAGADYCWCRLLLVPTIAGADYCWC